MQVCTLLQTDNHTSTPPLCFYRPDALPAAQPTVSKHWRHVISCLINRFGPDAIFRTRFMVSLAEQWHDVGLTIKRSWIWPMAAARTRRCNNSRQFVHAHLPLSPSSKIWYRQKLGRGRGQITSTPRNALAPYLWSHSVSSYKFL